MPYLLGEVICWGYKLYECQSGARECVSHGQDMPSKLPNLPGSGTLYKCQERFHLQLTCRYVSLAHYPKTCRKNLPWVCVQMLRSRFGVAVKCLCTKNLKASSERELLTMLSPSPATSRRWRKQKLQRVSSSVLSSCTIDCIDRRIKAWNSGHFENFLLEHQP